MDLALAVVCSVTREVRACEGSPRGPDEGACVILGACDSSGWLWVHARGTE